MLQKTLRAAVAAGAVVAALAFVAGSSHEAQAAHPDLFYNYYVGPSPVAGGVPAQMYISPRPTPPYVGHTWITYQPLMPNEMLYKHHRHYYRYYPNGGWNSTKVCWW